MKQEIRKDALKRYEQVTKNRPLLWGAIGSLALVAGWSLLRDKQKSRRYSDRAADRRQPMSLFTPGMYLRRREIDRSGMHPLFERRQAVYNAY